MLCTIALLYLDAVHADVFYMKIVYWICFTINVVWVFGFLILTINQITAFLGIKCFSV